MLDGISATRVIRSLGYSVPVVAVTGNALHEDTEAFRAAGADEVLSKPVNRQSLVKAMTELGVLPK